MSSLGKRIWPFGRKQPEAEDVKAKLRAAEQETMNKVASKAPHIRSFCNGSIVGYIVGLLATSKPLLGAGKVKTWLLSQLLTGVVVGTLWTIANHVRKRRWIRRISS